MKALLLTLMLSVAVAVSTPAGYASESPYNTGPKVETATELFNPRTPAPSKLTHWWFVENIIQFLFELMHGS